MRVVSDILRKYFQWWIQEHIRVKKKKNKNNHLKYEY